jgi:glyoxylase-like metal-dependent hydrolase (beta-lactamase superfamily II)
MFMAPPMGYNAGKGQGGRRMLFRQLFEPVSSTYTYLLACDQTGQAALIDPVLESLERDLDLVKALGLTLACTIETHIHADHVTGAGRLRAITGSKAGFPAASGAECVDFTIAEGDPIAIGELLLRPIYTPGHTDDHHAYVLERNGAALVFTGDALMIDGCGRTDFQNGDAATLYRSVHQKIFALGDDTLVYPAHDYNQRHVSSVGQERARNPRLGGGKTVEEFVAIMAGLNLPRPKKMDVAVPANRACGEIQAV